MAQKASRVVETDSAERRPSIRSVLWRDDVSTLQSLLGDSQVKFQATLLHTACEYDCPQCVHHLLRYTTSTTLKKLYDVNGYTPFHTAAYCNQIEVINVLFSRDQSLLDCPSTCHETPLMIGCLAGHINVAKHLLGLGANTHAKTAHGSTLVHYAASSGVAEVLEHVLQLDGVKEYVDTQNNHGETPAYNAMSNGCAKCVAVLCKHGANFYIRNNSSMTAVDIAKSLGNQECLTVFNNLSAQKIYDGVHTTALKSLVPNTSAAHKAICGVPEELSANRREYTFPPTPPPSSLRNDQKGEFHGSSRVEIDTPLHGEDEDTSGEDSRQDEHDGFATNRVPSRATTRSLRDHRSDKRQLQNDHSSGMDRVSSLPTTFGASPSQLTDFPATRPMKKKVKAPKPAAPDHVHGVETAHKKHIQKQMRRRTSDRPMTDPAKKRTGGSKGSEKRFPLENLSPKPRSPEDSIFSTKVLCSRCGNFMWGRTTTYEHADDIKLQDAHISGAKRVEQPSVFCPDCDRYMSQLSSKSDSNLDRSKLPPQHVQQKTTAPPQQNEGHNQEQRDSGIFLSSSFTQSHQSNGTPPVDDRASPIAIDEHPENVRAKYGDTALLRCRAHSTMANRSELKYQWYMKKGGSKEKIKGAKGPELHRKVDMKKTLVFSCRISLASNKDIFRYSGNAQITPILVSFDEQPQPINGYLGEKAQLSCRAVTAPGIKGPISYLWLRRTSKESTPEFYRATPDGNLTFDPLTPESEGYYTCQAGIDIQHAESNEVHVIGRIQPKRSAGKKTSLLQISKEPRSYAVSEGSQLSLSCEAEQSAGGTGPLHYQWYHDGRAITGATSSSYIIAGVQSPDVGVYHCEITNECGQSMTTKQAEVALAHSDTTARVDHAGKSSIQIRQIEARRHLKTKRGRRFAREKVALVIGNWRYDADSLPNLSTPENDVKNYTIILTECGFKVFSLVNLKYNEMTAALQNFYNLLVPGIYAIFAYTGHGCTYQNIDYFIPVDAHGPDPSQCISSAKISDDLQQHLCRVFKFLDCCRVKSAEESRYLPSNTRKHNFGNLFEIWSCADGQKAYENQSQSCSSFNQALTTAIKQGGTFMDVFDNTKQLMAGNFESTHGATYAEPQCSSSMNDREISFHDTVMLDNPQHEGKLDQLLNTWKSVHTPPPPMKVQISGVLSQFLNVVGLEFKCEFSNVLLVEMKWQICPTTCTNCSVATTSEDQDVVIEKTALPRTEAQFRITSLQRLKANLKLNITFSITSTDGTLSKHTVSQDLQCRPLYAQLS